MGKLTREKVSYRMVVVVLVVLILLRATLYYITVHVVIRQKKKGAREMVCSFILGCFTRAAALLLLLQPLKRPLAGAVQIVERHVDYR